MSGLDFLTPVSEEMALFAQSCDMQQLGSKMVLHTETDFPDLEQVKLAIVFVLEYRNSEQQYELDFDNKMRQQLYSMYPGNWLSSIADLGNIIPGESAADTYFVVQSLCAELIKRRIIPILVGGSQDLTYPMYRSYDKLDQMVNLVGIDYKFDLGKEPDLIKANSYLSQIILEQPNNLFNYANLGYQTYYNSQEEIDLIDKLYFEAYRLGEISNKLELAEPVFRDADLVSVDIDSVAADVTANREGEPNGFSGKEICALLRYAGISDKTSALGLFNLKGNLRELKLISQMIWYFIDGFQYRAGDYPFGSKENYIRYIVPNEGTEMVFYKSDKTGRWWIEIENVLKHTKTKKTSLLPCSYDDYLQACEQDLPERYWKAVRKAIV
jgi:hypothetical protein